MKMHINYKILISSIFIALIFISCNNSVQVPQENSTLLFSKPELVDSAYVTCCCTSITRFFSDTLFTNSYKKIKVEFNGATNSDGSMIDIFYNTTNSNNNRVFTVRNQDSINGSHSISFNKPADTLVIELRNTIFPPVCGQNEVKYTRSRDFKIFGIQ